MPFSLAAYWDWDWNKLFHNILETKRNARLSSFRHHLDMSNQITFCVKFLAWMETVWSKVWEVRQEADWREAGHLDTELSIRGQREVIQTGQQQDTWENERETCMMSLLQGGLPPAFILSWYAGVDTTLRRLDLSEARSERNSDLGLAVFAATQGQRLRVSSWHETGLRISHSESGDRGDWPLTCAAPPGWWRGQAGTPRPPECEAAASTHPEPGEYYSKIRLNGVLLAFK